jgi:spermidine synthase
MRFSRSFLIFSYGLFTIAAQALLFREFITTFEGNDISVGIFFASWLLWVAVGATLVYRIQSLAVRLLDNIEFVLLAFLPAFVLEWFLIVQAREIAGIEAYTLWSIRDIVVLSFLVNVPVSFITGAFFPVACRWIQQDTEYAVSRVYIIEAAGSFLGGLGATLLLGLGVSAVKISFVLAFVLSIAAAWIQFAKTKQLRKAGAPIFSPCVLGLLLITSLLPTCILLGLGVRADKYLMQHVRVMKWTKLLPKEALKGSFQTPQADYLYGMYRDQWVVVREGSVCEALPDETTAGQIAAIVLCQNPEAKRLFVVGSGLGLCRQLLKLSQCEEVAWAHSDTEYVQKVNTFIPSELRITDERFHALTSDARIFLAEKNKHYDIVVLNLPDATSSVLNRYYTLEFYQQVKEALRPDGVLAVRVAGGENIMGTELINLGASTKRTLQKVFSRLVLTPGEDTWFVVSDSENLTGEPGMLRDRFAKIDKARLVFSPQALLSVYLPDRAETALENYAAADLPKNLLINRDSRPLTHLYSLLLAAKQSGAPIARIAKQLAVAGPLAYLGPILVVIALRITYVFKTPTQRGMPNSAQTVASSFDSTFLIFSAGLVGIGAVIVLMYLYQTRSGSLYLHIGIISSLFMVGLTAGAMVFSRLVKRAAAQASRVTHPHSLLLALLTVHVLILATVGYLPADQQTHPVFAIAFVLCGFCAGGYFPLAAEQLTSSGFEAGQIGSKLETADHIGASAGGLLTGLALVPVLGATSTMLVFIALLVANTPLVALRLREPARAAIRMTDPRYRLQTLGYVLLGVAASIILCSNLLAAAGEKLRPSLPPSAAQALAGESRLEPASTVVGESGRKMNYFDVYGTESDGEEKPAGYIFSSEDLAPEVRGFGGKMNLAIYVDPNGTLRDFHILQSNETPAYLELLDDWPDRLHGHALFRPEPFSDVDAVTGATISCEAILSALQKSGQRFAAEVLGQEMQAPDSEQTRWAALSTDIRGIYLIVAFVISLIVIYRAGFYSRVAVLVLNLVVGGIILNAQYSAEQIASILSFHIPAAGLTGTFVLIIGVPILVALFGNMYCGYICPFGAAQELLGYAVPRRSKQAPAAETMQKARFVKYVVLFVLILAFFLSRNRTTLAADPLISIFSPQFWQTTIVLMLVVALLGSIFYTRFWCRYLCPVGAFLSLFNNVILLKRYLPKKRFGKCEFGLRPNDQMDCIYCDRCRYLAKQRLPRPAHQQAGAMSRSFLLGVVVIGILVSAVSVKKWAQVTGAGIKAQPTPASSAGQVRDVDMDRIRKMIEQNRLSDREAEFYKKIE